MSENRPRPTDLTIQRVLLIKHHRRPSEPFLRNAVDLASRCSARLTFADALEGADRIDEIFRAARLQELESFLTPHLDGMAADYRLLTGDLAAAANAVADEFDLVFLAENERHAESSPHDVTRLLRHASLPVWLDGGAEHPPRHVLAAADVLTRDPAKRRLNPVIIGRAAQLASAYGAKLEVLSVRTPPSPLLFAQRLTTGSDRLMASHDEVRKRLEAAFEEARRLFPTPARKPRLTVVTGHVADQIERRVEASQTDLLVAGCLGRTGFTAWLPGDTTVKLARRLSCSILAVKPTPERSAELSTVERKRAA